MRVTDLSKKIIALLTMLVLSMPLTLIAQDDKKPDEKKPPVDSGTKPDDKPRHTVDQRLGLGVTLFMRDANGMRFVLLIRDERTSGWMRETVSSSLSTVKVSVVHPPAHKQH